MLNQSKKEKAKKTMMTIQSTQSFSPIQDVSEGIIITKDRRFIKILEISPINFLLRSEDEKRDIAEELQTTVEDLYMPRSEEKYHAAGCIECRGEFSHADTKAYILDLLDVYCDVQELIAEN